MVVATLAEFHQWIISMMRQMRRNVFVHTVFCFHYAHIYYTDPTSLQFPGTKEPCYSDFMYLALVVGMTAQVSDVGITDRTIRRTATAHGVISFVFNTALVALMVNIAASAITERAAPRCVSWRSIFSAMVRSCSITTTLSGYSGSGAT
mgnify:CR=1 FL=1